MLKQEDTKQYANQCLELYLCLSVHGSVPPTFMTWPYTTQGSCFSILWRCGMVYQTAITLFLKDSRRHGGLFFHSHKNQEDLFSRIKSKYHQKHHKTKAFLTFQKQNTTTSCLCGCLSSFLAILTHPVHCRVAQLSHQSVGTYWQMLNFTRRKVLDLEPPRWVAIWHKNSAGWYVVCCWLLADVLSLRLKKSHWIPLGKNWSELSSSQKHLYSTVTTL